MSQNDIKHILTDKLRSENRLWSYDSASIDMLPDEILVEKVLLYLDLDDIGLLFKLYSFQFVKSVWLSRLVPQGDYLYTLNRFFAWYYFKVKRPDAYIKAMATRYYNRVA